MSWCLLLVPAPLLPPITWARPSFRGTAAPKGQLVIIPQPCYGSKKLAPFHNPADPSISKSLRILLEDKEMWLYPEFCHTSREKLFQAGFRTQLIAQMAASSHLCLFPFSLRHDCSVEAAERRPSYAFVAFPCLLDSLPYKKNCLICLTALWIVCKVYLKSRMHQCVAVPEMLHPQSGLLYSILLLCQCILAK